MSKKLYFILSLVLVFILVGCGGGGGSTPLTNNAGGAGGAGSKGPFVLGSTVTAYKLDDNGSRSATVASVSTTTTDNLGTYSFSSFSWSGATELEINGNYFNENDGSINNAGRLSAITNVVSGERVSVNINVLTNLAAQRTITLMLAGTALEDAKITAQAAVVDLFNLNLAAGVELEDLDLTVGSGTNAGANAELLRISAAIAAEPTVLATLELAIADGNVTNDSNGSAAFATLAQAVNDVNMTAVANNLEQNLSVTDAPDANDTDTNASFASNAHIPVIDTITTQTKNEDDLAFNITLHATDADTDPAYNTVTFTSVTSSDPTKATVALSGTTLTITPVANANGAVTITVTASDGTFLDTETFTLIVTSQNDAPVLGNISDVNKNEDFTPFTITLSATDIDGETISNFSAISLDTSKATVNVLGNILTVSPVLNSNGTVDINVTATDGNGGVGSQIFTLTMTPQNDAPIADNNTSIINEDNNLVINLRTHVSDSDGEVPTISINTNPAHGTLSHLGDIYTYIPSANYNGTDSFTYTANDGTATATGTVNITINPQNDIPTITTNGGNSPYLVHIAEGETAVTTITGSDADGETDLSYYINDGDTDFEFFHLDVTSGALSFITAPNFENPADDNADNLYDVNVYVLDPSGDNIGADFIVQVIVTDVADLAPTLTATTLSIDENATSSAAIGQVTIDNMGDRNITSFSLTGSGSTNFDINASGYITLANGAGLDYETNTSYTLQATATNSSGTSDTVDITISINNIPDIVPTLSPSTISVSEGVGPIVQIGSIQVDNAGDSPITAYTLVSGADGKFIVNSSGAIITNNQLDFETTPSYTLVVNASNGAGESANINIVINLTNENDNTPTITSNGGGNSASITVQENNVSVTTLTATDADTSDTITYSINNSPGSPEANKFDLNSTTGVLTFKVAPDYENPLDSDSNSNGYNTYLLEVLASDGTRQDVQTITVVVSNLIDTAPTLTNLTASIDENATAGTVIGNVIVSDSGDAPITSIILSGTNASNFEVNTTGHLSLASGVALDYETTPHYTLTAVANNGLESNVVTIDITVNNVNESPVANDGNYTTQKDTNLTIDLKVLVSDEDSGETLTISNLGATSNGALTNLGNGMVIYTPDNNYTGSDGFTFDVNDSNGLIGSATINISIINTKELWLNNAETSVTETSANLNSLNGAYSTSAFAYMPGSRLSETQYAIGAYNTDDTASDSKLFIYNPTTKTDLTVVSTGSLKRPQVLHNVRTGKPAMYNNKVLLGSGQAWNGGTGIGTLDITTNTFNGRSIPTTDLGNSNHMMGNFGFFEGSTAYLHMLFKGNAEWPGIKIIKWDIDTDTISSLDFTSSVESEVGAIFRYRADFIIRGKDSDHLVLGLAYNNQYYIVEVQESTQTVIRKIKLNDITSDSGYYEPIFYQDNLYMIPNSTTGDANGMNLVKVDINNFTSQNITIDMGSTYNTRRVSHTIANGFAQMPTRETGLFVSRDVDIVSNDTDKQYALMLNISQLKFYFVSLDGSNFQNSLSDSVHDQITFKGLAGQENGQIIGTTHWRDVSVSCHNNLCQRNGVGILHAKGKEAPRAKPTLANSTISISESVVSGTTIGSVTVTSQGDAPISSYTLVSGDAGKFSIENNGTIVTQSTLDYETTPSYSLVVNAINSEGTSSNVTVDINLIDENDNTPVIGGGDTASIGIQENNITVTTITATDEDSNEDITYSILNDPASPEAHLFNLNLTTGVLTFKVAPDYENPTDDNQDGYNTYIIIVQASDGTNVDSQMITVTVSNLIDTPPTLDNFIGNINENTTITDIVGDINIVDAGDGTITGFVLDESTFVGDSNAKILLAGNLDYETTNSYSFTMYATSTSGNSNTVNVTITINDINEAPEANDASYSTVKDTNLTIDLKSISSDPDNEQTLSLNSLQSPTQEGGTVVHNGDGNITYSPASGFTGTDTFTYTVEDNSSEHLTDTGTITVTVTETETETNTSSEGQAIDPYIVGAQFWADVNNDGVEDANETSTLSDINGSFSFSIFVPDNTKVSMIRQGLHNGHPFTGNISARFSSSHNGIISPITSLGSVGFTDSEIITLLTENGMTASEFNATITVSELYTDPFNTSLLPLDGNMSTYTDAKIQQFRRVLLANVATNSALTMQGGYGLDKTDMELNFFTDPDGAGGALSPIAMMINAGVVSLDVDSLREGHARVHARIFVTISNYIRDKVAAVWGDTNNMMTTLQSSMNSMPNIINALSSAYQSAYGYGLTDPQFGWVDVNNDGTYAPLFYVQPNELGNHDVSIVYNDGTDDHNITFASSGHSYLVEGVDTGDNWQVVNGELTESGGHQFELLGDTIKINGTSYNIIEVEYNGDNFIPSN